MYQSRAPRTLGFTLVELLVVLAILGLLAGLVGPQVMKFLGTSKTKTARLQVGKEQVGITRLEQVGAYALKVYFDDGHNSGLYDWQYLYQLGRDWPARWQDYLGRLAAAGHQRKGPDPFDDLLARGESPSERPQTAAI